MKREFYEAGRSISLCLMAYKKYFILFLFCLVFSGCEKPNLFSSWRDHEIIIDGKYQDWGTSTTYYDEKAKVVLDLANDADYMYVCIISRNREIETQVMESGFIVWFDPDGGKNKLFGISFPIGLKRMGMSIEEKEKIDMTRDWQDQQDKSGLIDREKERLRDKDFNKRLETLEGLQERLEIIERSSDFKNKDKRLRSPPRAAGKWDTMKEKPGGPQGDFPKGGPLELSLEEAGKLGIEAKLGRENDYFVYELKVPISKSIEHPHAIGVKESKLVGLGLEVGGMGAGNHMGKNMHPGDGMPRGGGMRREGMFEGERGFQLWMTVTLSSGGKR